MCYNAAKCHMIAREHQEFESLYNGIFIHRSSSPNNNNKETSFLNNRKQALGLHNFLRKWPILTGPMESFKTIYIAVQIFLKVVIVLIQVYNWKTRNLSPICRCGLADILYPVKFRK